MKFHLKSILLILGFFLFIENPLISAEFDITDFNTAKTVANNILLINRDNKTLLEHGLDTIMKDHSLSHHATGDS